MHTVHAYMTQGVSQGMHCTACPFKCLFNKGNRVKINVCVSGHNVDNRQFGKLQERRWLFTKSALQKLKIWQVCCAMSCIIHKSFKGKGVYGCFMEIHLTVTECHLPYGITQCYLPSDTSEQTLRLNPSHTGRYSMYLPQRDGRLSWPRWLVTYRDVLPAHRRSPIQVLTGPGVD